MNLIFAFLGYAVLYSLSFFLTGRGLKSHAYIHSVQFSHHVFLNLHTLKFYCLPDNYEIIDSSLEDITVRVPEGWLGTRSPKNRPGILGSASPRGASPSLGLEEASFPLGGTRETEKGGQDP